MLGTLRPSLARDTLGTPPLSIPPKGILGVSLRDIFGTSLQREHPLSRLRLGVSPPEGSEVAPCW